MKLVIDINEKDYLECVKRVEEIREKGYMIENLKYKIIIADGIPLEEELEKIIAKIDFEEKWLLDIYAKEYRVSANDIKIAMSGIRSVVSGLQGDNKQSRCNNCQNNTDELSGECYECVKGIEDWYEPIAELKGEQE